MNDSNYAILTGIKADKYTFETAKSKSSSDVVRRTVTKAEYFIPSWHKGVTYDERFFNKAVHLLKKVSLEDLTRYLKVVGFDTINVEKNEAAQIVAAEIIRAKSESQYMEGGKDDSIAVEYLQCNKSSLADIITGKGARSQYLREILCCMEGRYLALKEKRDKEYKDECDRDAACKDDQKLKPVYGLSSNDDCGRMLYLPKGAKICKAIPELMVTVFENKEEKSVIAGEEIIKNIFLNHIRMGKETEEEITFNFHLVAYLQYKTYLKLKEDFHQLLTLPVSSKSTRFFEIEEPGAILGKQAVIAALKRISGSLLSEGKLSGGSLRHAVAFVAFGRAKKVPEIDAEGKVTSVKKKVLIPVLTDAEHLALWFVSHLTMLFDASKMIKTFVAEKIVHRLTHAKECVKSTGAAGVRSTSFFEKPADCKTYGSCFEFNPTLKTALDQAEKTIKDEDEAKKTATDAKEDYDEASGKETKDAAVKEITGDRLDDTICSIACEKTWHSVAKDNHDLIASVVIDGLKSVRAFKEADGHVEAVTVLTHVVKNALDDSTAQALARVENATVEDVFTKLNVLRYLAKAPQFKTAFPHLYKHLHGEDTTVDYLETHLSGDVWAEPSDTA
jgi:hypothetical protein